MYFLELDFLKYLLGYILKVTGCCMFGVDYFLNLNIPGILMALLGVLLYSIVRAGKGGASRRQHRAYGPLKNNGQN